MTDLLMSYQPNTTFDIISVGNATIDAFLAIHDANIHCRIDEKACELCVRYGEKIQLDSCQFLLGGNACNVAVGAFRLGLRSALCAEIGDDEFAQKILTGLTKEGVDTTLLVQKEHMASSFSVGIQFKGERTLFVEHVTREHKFDLSNVKTQWIYLTSLGKEWKNAYTKVLEYIKTAQCKLAFSPGTLQLTEGYAGIENVLRAADILFLNKEEGIQLVKSQNGHEVEDMQELLTALHGMGPKTVVVTNGNAGSDLFDKNTVSRMDIMQMPVVEKTGAGDAYASGFLSAIISGLPTKEAMRWGTVNAGSVIGSVGAQPGLLTKAALQQRV